MASSVESSLILKLIDQISAPSRAVSESLARIDRQMSGLRGASARIADFGKRSAIASADMKRAVAPMNAFRRSMTGLRVPTLDLGGIRGLAASAGVYFGAAEGYRATVGAAREMQAALTEIGIKADLTDGQLKQLSKGIAGLAPATNQTMQDLTAGVDAMVTLGLSAKDAAAALPAIGRAATATVSSMSDLSAASVSAMQNMAITAGDVQKMLDAMASAGNAGAFELRDMAKYFPQLTAAARSLGIDGVDGVADLAASLQIARRGAGDASTAANNLANFMQKIVTPETRKNFRKFGVDVTKELEKAQKKGISPIEHFIELVDEKTKGGRADLLGQIFGDKQVLDFVRPMIADFKDYIRIRDQANRADGTVSEAYVRRMQTANEKLKAFQIRLSSLGASVGNRVLGPLGDSAEYLTDVFDTLDQRVGVFDRILAAANAFVAGLGFNADGAGGLKGIIEYFAGVKTSADQAGEELGRIAAKFRKAGEDMRASINGLSLTGVPDLSSMFKGMTIDPTTIAAIGAAAFALRRMAGAMARLAFSTPVKLALLAGGLSTLAGGAKDMSTVDWVTLATGLSIFAGSLKKFGAVAGILAGIAAIKEFGPKVAEKRREPKPGEPLDYINRVAGYDVTKSREERRAALRNGGTADLQKDDDAFAGYSKWEREVATTPKIKVPLLEMPTNPAIFNELDRASRQATETGRQIDQALSLTVTPVVDTTSLQNALIIANALRAAVSSIGSAGASRGGPAGSNKLKFGGPRAEGGPIRQGMNYLVGERGPELFTANRNGSIVPNHALGGRGGGGAAARPGIGGVQVEKIEINVQGGGNAEEIGRIAGIEIKKVFQRLDQQLRRSRHISIDGRGDYGY